MFRSLRISHVEFRFPGSEKLGPSRNGRMERNFPVIPTFRNFRPTSRGTPKISERNSGNCLFHSLHNPEFPEFFVEWKAPNFEETLRSQINVTRSEYWENKAHKLKLSSSKVKFCLWFDFLCESNSAPEFKQKIK